MGDHLVTADTVKTIRKLRARLNKSVKIWNSNNELVGYLDGDHLVTADSVLKTWKLYSRLGKSRQITSQKLSNDKPVG